MAEAAPNRDEAGFCAEALSPEGLACEPNMPEVVVGAADGAALPGVEAVLAPNRPPGLEAAVTVDDPDAAEDAGVAEFPNSPPLEGAVDVEVVLAAGLLPKRPAPDVAPWVDCAWDELPPAFPKSPPLGAAGVEFGLAPNKPPACGVLDCPPPKRPDPVDVVPD